MENNFASIVMVTHTSKYPWRNEVSQRSIASLHRTVKEPHQIIIFNNDIGFRLGKARNEAIKQANGEYLVITDDDIDFKDNWLEMCIEMVGLGDIFLVAPVHQPRISRWELEPFMGYRRNYRTGSNCMVMRKKYLDKIGLFDEDKQVDNCGKRYADNIAKAGYSFLITKEPMAFDLAFNKHSYL